MTCYKIRHMIKTTSYNQHDIIRDIQALYIPEGVELDPTYSRGVFYRAEGIIEPRLKYDLFPRDEDTVQASAEKLPLENESINSIIFDPPFLAGFTKEKPTGIMGSRFHGFKCVPDLWAWYNECLIEFGRILKTKGHLVFKCQDTVSSGKNWFSHCNIMNRALEHGFYPKDLFILTAKHRIKGHNHGNQKHARKFHTYFWVFQKTKCKVRY